MKKQTWVEIVLSVSLFLLCVILSQSFILLVENGRDHGGAFVSAGNFSQYDMVQPINTFFALFSTLAFSLLFFYVAKQDKKSAIMEIGGFVIFIIGFFLSLGYMFFMKGSGAAIGYSKIYRLINIAFIGVGVISLPLLIKAYSKIAERKLFSFRIKRK